MKRDGTELISLDKYNPNSMVYTCTLLGVHPDPKSGHQKNPNGQIIWVAIRALRDFVVVNPEFRLVNDLKPVETGGGDGNTTNGEIKWET